VKGIRFRDHKYVGDPINAIKIFSDKEVDELVFLDISATKEGRTPPLNLIQRIADECFVPFSVGGGIRSVQAIRQLLSAGAEKVSLNSAAVEQPALIKEAAKVFGNQSIIVSIDTKRTRKGSYRVYTHCGSRKTRLDPVSWATQAEKFGAGEILLTSIDRDGTMQGYDLNLIKTVCKTWVMPFVLERLRR
jgi:cyclase